MNLIDREKELTRSVNSKKKINKPKLEILKITLNKYKGPNLDLYTTIKTPFHNYKPKPINPKSFENWGEQGLDETARDLCELDKYNATCLFGKLSRLGTMPRFVRFKYDVIVDGYIGCQN